MNLHIAPEKGTAVIFTSFVGGACTQMAEHEAMIVHGGEKFVLQRWYHADGFVPASHEENQILCDHGRNCRRHM